MRSLIMVLVSLLLVGCIESGGGSADSAVSLLPGGGGGAPVSVPVSFKTGFGFSCVMFEVSGSGRVYCRQTGAPDARLGILSASFTLYAATANPVTRFETWDDTVCLTTQVSTQPQDRLPGSATYCFGDASLGANYSTYPMVYGGVPYSAVNNGASELSFAELPFVGSDTGMEVFTDEGGTWLVMLDSSASVTESTLTCDLSSTELVCSGFTVNL